MKVIHPELQSATGSVAVSADSEYPVANLFDAHQSNACRADGSSTMVLHLKISAGSHSLLGLANTNAQTAAIAICRDSDVQNLDNAAAINEGGGLVGIPCTGHGCSESQVVVIRGSANYDGIYTLPVQTLGSVDKIIITATYAAEAFAGDEEIAVARDSTEKTLTVNRLAWSYAVQTVACTVTFVLVAASGNAEAGLFRAGTGYSLRDPKYGWKQDRKIYSVRAELNAAGAYYHKDLPSCRVFTGIDVSESTANAYILEDFVDVIGLSPKWWIMERFNDDRYSIFGTMLFDHFEPIRGGRQAVRFSIEEEK